MPPAKTESLRLRPTRGLTGAALLLLLLMLALPAMAMLRLRQPLDIQILASLYAVLSVTAFFVYRSDKQRAAASEWRIPEATLHLIALFGGWPGAFLAQRCYRHKTAKLSFQFTFWSIVFLHQFVALDSLLGWRLSARALAFSKSLGA